uniref:Uncharacterized protein n=1 Tax=Anguilla anguilla TaxID=7936 RepID=A0A0E9QVR5_ANGAN
MEFQHFHARCLIASITVRKRHLRPKIITCVSRRRAEPIYVTVHESNLKCG